MTGAVLLAGAALAAAAAPAGAQEVPRVQEWAVDGATRGMLVEDHRVPLVALRVVFPAGTWSPWVRREHVQEAFELSFYDAHGTFRARADRLAADVSLTMGERTAVLGVNCRKEDLPEVLALVRDILAGRDYDRHELKRRKQARRLEYQAALKEPGFRVWQAAAWRLFAAGDPRRYAWEPPPPVSTDSGQLAGARDTLVRLPGRIVGWAGDLTRAEAEPLAAGLLPAAGAAPADIAPHFEPASPAVAAERVRVPMSRLTQVYFGDVRPALAMTDPDYPALLIADHVLGGHFYSRLYEALRHEAGDTYGAVTRMRTELEPGTYMLWTFTKTANAASTEAKLRGVLERFHAQGITEAERSAAAGYLLGRRAFDRQSPAQVLERHVWEIVRGLPAGFRDGLAERAAALRVEDINAFIHRFHDPARFTLVEAVPK